MVNKSYIARVEQDENGDLILVFPDDMIKTLGWDENTQIEWIDNNNGTFSIKKVEENVTFGRA